MYNYIIIQYMWILEVKSKISEQEVKLLTEPLKRQMKERKSSRSCLSLFTVFSDSPCLTALWITSLACMWCTVFVSVCVCPCRESLPGDTLQLLLFRRCDSDAILSPQSSAKLLIGLNELREN